MESEPRQQVGSNVAASQRSDGGRAEEPILASLVAPAPDHDALSAPQFLHPTSIIFDVLSSVGQLIMATVIAFVASGTNSLFALGAAALIVGATTLRGAVRFFTLKYQLVRGELRINEGLLFHRHRTVPAARIQNIDLLQNPLHHLLGVAEVRIETAGGSEPEARLRVLALDDVERLRKAIFGLAHSESAAAPPSVASTDGDATSALSRAHGDASEVVHQIPVGQLVQAGLISNRGFILIPVVFGMFFQFRLEERLEVARVAQMLPQDLSWGMTIGLSAAFALLVLVILRLASVAWFLLRFYGYRLQRHGEDLRVSCGLFTRVSATVPRHRIQFISIHQTILGRRFGLATLRLETAGGTGEGDEDAAQTVSRRWFLPVISDSEVPRILANLRPALDIRWEDLNWQPTSPWTSRRMVRVAVVRAGLVALVGLGMWWPWGAVAGVVALPPLVWYAVRRARSLRYARWTDGVVFRSGIMTRKTSLTFFDKIQNAALSQSPFDRRWDMATLMVDTAAAGPAQHRIRVDFLPSAVAVAELDQIAIETSRT